MNILSILSAPLKHFYGANSTGDATQRPWSMTISRKSTPFKVMKYVYSHEDNIPNFVKNNGCPWVMVSTLFTIILPFIWLVKSIGSLAQSLHDFLSNLGCRSSETEKVEVNLEEWLDGYKVTLKDLLDNWWTDCDYDSMSLWKSRCECALFDKRTESEEFLSDFKMKDSTIYDILKMGRWARGEALVVLYARQNPDTYIQDLANMEKPEFKDTIEGKKVIERRRIRAERDAVIEAKRVKRDAVALKITKVWQFITPLLLVVLYAAILSLVVWLVASLPFIWSLIVGAVSTWKWSIFLEILGVFGVAGMILTTIIFILKCGQPLFMHPKMEPVRNAMGWVLVCVVTPLALLCGAVGGIFKIIGMAAKSECPVNKFKD